jgi:formamidopyrimidine-DNA glycosylase
VPELPEVETTRRGIAPHLTGRLVAALRVRDPRLRWPVPPELETVLPGRRILSVGRRGKYLILELDPGSLILHLGMSGSLRVLPGATAPRKHDHWDLLLEDGQCLRMHDPRRFGALLWSEGPASDHPLLRHLGPEPLEPGFSGEHLRLTAGRRRCAVKSLVMDGRVVAGVGNIYASEALFVAGIHPGRACHRIALARYRRLAAAIQETLRAAIGQGGTTLRDFVREDGAPGYFALSLKVYGKAGLPCPRCATVLSHRLIGQRSSVFCPRCQR